MFFRACRFVSTTSNDFLINTEAESFSSSLFASDTNMRCFHAWILNVLSQPFHHIHRSITIVVAENIHMICKKFNRIFSPKRAFRCNVLIVKRAVRPCVKNISRTLQWRWNSITLIIRPQIIVLNPFLNVEHLFDVAVSQSFLVRQMPVTIFQVLLTHENIAIKYHFTSGFTFLVSDFHIPTGVDNLTMVLLKNITPDKILLVVICSSNGFATDHISIIIRHRFCLNFHHGRHWFSSSNYFTTHINNRQLNGAFIKLLIN